MHTSNVAIGNEDTWPSAAIHETPSHRLQYSLPTRQGEGKVLELEGDGQRLSGFGGHGAGGAREPALQAEIPFQVGTRSGICAHAGKHAAKPQRSGSILFPPPSSIPTPISAPIPTPDRPLPSPARGITSAKLTAMRYRHLVVVVFGAAMIFQLAVRASGGVEATPYVPLAGPMTGSPTRAPEAPAGRQCGTITTIVQTVIATSPPTTTTITETPPQATITITAYEAPPPSTDGRGTDWSGTLFSGFHSTVFGITVIISSYLWGGGKERADKKEKRREQKKSERERVREERADNREREKEKEAEAERERVTEEKAEKEKE
ncbi:hypothetical protein DFH27DRAFT_524380 [Peziza echinospora]|nr:hypothetical protein DFH27DRAFT_524380 [Peziza echinospora]